MDPPSNLPSPRRNYNFEENEYSSDDDSYCFQDKRAKKYQTLFDEAAAGLNCRIPVNNADDPMECFRTFVNLLTPNISYEIRKKMAYLILPEDISDAYRTDPPCLRAPFINPNIRNAPVDINQPSGSGSAASSSSTNDFTNFIADNNMKSEESTDEYDVLVVGPSVPPPQPEDFMEACELLDDEELFA